MSRSRPIGLRRRDLLKAAMAGAAGLVLPAAAPSTACAEPVVTRLGDGFHVLAGLGGNVLVRDTADGRVLVDSGAAAHEAELLTALEQLPGAASVALLINTHWHLDQVGSNDALGRAGATIVAHEKTRLRLAVGYYLPDEDRYREPLPAAGRPSRTFHAHGETLAGSETIEYGYLLEAHTDGDIYVRFPGANVLAVGDALSPVRDPQIDWYGGGWLGGRVDSLALLLELADDDTLIVPSYGPAVGRAALAAEHSMMLTLFEKTTELLRQGYSADEMLAAGVLDDLPRTFDDPLRFLNDVHKSLWAHHNTISHDIV